MTPFLNVLLRQLVGKSLENQQSEEFLTREPLTKTWLGDLGVTICSFPVACLSKKRELGCLAADIDLSLRVASLNAP